MTLRALHPSTQPQAKSLMAASSLELGLDLSKRYSGFANSEANT